jgi:hypothetical protein
MGPGSRFACPGRRKLCSRRDAPGVLQENLGPRNTEGAGKTGCALHPRSRVRCAQKMLHTSIQGSGEHPAFPAQWLYGLYDFVLVTGFLATIISFSFRFRQLDASTGASDPNDFAVRKCRARQSPSRPPLPASRLRRWPTPLWWDRDGGSCAVDLPDGATGIFFAEGLDRLLVICPSGYFVAVFGAEPRSPHAR